MKKAIALALAGPAMCVASAAAAQQTCAPEFVDTSTSVSVPNIIVTAGGVTEESFSFRVRNGGTGGACPASLRIVRSSTSPASSNIAYSIRSGGQTLDILPSETSPPTPGSVLNLSDTQTGPGDSIQMQLIVPSSWGLAAGSTTEDLIIQMYDQTGDLVDEMQLPVSISIQPAVELRVVGVTGQTAIASISLGELDPQNLNTSDPFGVRIWSTSPYTVSFVSENNGGLMHSSSTDRIEYDLYMNNREVSLAGAPAATVAQGTTALGDLHPLTVRVEPFRAKAGQYSDRVEVTVSAT